MGTDPQRVHPCPFHRDHARVSAPLSRLLRVRRRSSRRRRDAARSARLKGQELIDKFMAVVDRHRPLHVSIVGGEPLVRYRELGVILPELAKRRIHGQIVTSAVREIPKEWRGLFRLSIVVSIDGLQPEHDKRRAPATYDRILKHIEGHSITVHCTITRQQVNRAGYIEEFLRIWSARREVEKIWISLYTPQIGEMSAERLSPTDREQVVADLLALRLRYPKLDLPKELIEVSPLGS